jgi:hypothetical protein
MGTSRAGQGLGIEGGSRRLFLRPHLDRCGTGILVCPQNPIGILRKRTAGNTLYMVRVPVAHAGYLLHSVYDRWSRTECGMGPYVWYPNQRVNIVPEWKYFDLASASVPELPSLRSRCCTVLHRGMTAGACLDAPTSRTHRSLDTAAGHSGQ